MKAKRPAVVAMMAVICGVWLCALGVAPAEAAEQVKTIKLRGGDVQLINNDEQKPEAVINRKKFLFLPKYITLTETFRLSDRDVMILKSDEGFSYNPPTYRVFSLRTDGIVEEIENPYFGLYNRALTAEKVGDAVHFDLGITKT